MPNAFEIPIESQVIGRRLTSISARLPFAHYSNLQRQFFRGAFKRIPQQTARGRSNNYMEDQGDHEIVQFFGDVFKSVLFVRLPG